MSRRATGLAVLAALGVGFALRLPGLWTDFWLDEIWTWHLARGLHSALDVFTGIHHSNNHHLNTLLFYWIGEPAHWAVYRVPALLLGTASIALAAAVAAPRGRLEAVLAAWLTAGCFALIHFSSEARGSGPTVAFALGALWLLERDLARPRAWSAAAFGACVVAGFLFQLVFCFLWAGAFVYSGFELWRGGARGARLCAGMARLHAAPLLALAALWALDLRVLKVGSGPAPDAAWLAARTVGYALGLPVRSSLGLAWGSLGAALVGGGLWWLARRGDRLWVALAVAIVAAPLAVLGWLQPDVIAVRYFLIGIALTLVMLALPLADALRAGAASRALAILALAGFAVGNGVHLARFFELGRGGYEAALRSMAERTPGPRIEVGSSHDFRVGSVLAYYGRRLPEGKRLDYLPQRRWPAGGPEWLILDHQTRTRPPDPFLVSATSRYELVAEFDHAAISGYYWVLYRRLAPQGPGKRSEP